MPSRQTPPESRRPMPPKKAIAIMKKLLGETTALPGEPFGSPKRSQWKDTARGALEQAGVTKSLLESFDQSQGVAFNMDSTDEEMRQLSNRNLDAMTAVLNSAIEQLGWQIEEEAPRTEARKEHEPQPFAVKGPVKSTVSTFDVGDGHVLIVNGEVWRDTHVGSDSEILTTCSFYGESVPKVARLSFDDLAGYFDEVEIAMPEADKDLQSWDFAWIEAILLGSRRDQVVAVAFRLEYDLEFWANRYSISDLATALTKTLASYRTPLTYWQRDKNTIIHGFGVSITMSPENTVQDVLNNQQELKELVRLTKAELSERDTTAVNLVFDFPPPIKNACEQYLLYFVQFLSDLGIEANAEVKEQASKVLFSVTPANEKQALEKIRDALEAYLGLPLAPEFAMAASQFHDVAVSQLRANVLHLQSQIILAKAAIEMKNASLDAKDAQIALLQDRIDLRVFQPQPQLKEADAGKEELVKDVVSVKKWDYKFLEINFPELLRKLKRRLG